jgi:hypothetical protein
MRRIMETTTSTTRTLGVVELAQLLFTSPLQQADNPAPWQVRTAIDLTLTNCGGDCSQCTACVAQEAGDHPDYYTARMRWALALVEQVYGNYWRRAG